MTYNQVDKSELKGDLSLVYDLEKKLFLLGNIEGESLNYVSVAIEDLKMMAGQKVFVYETKEIYKLFVNTLEAPTFLDLKLAAYIDNSNLGFAWEDFQWRYSLEKFTKEDFGGIKLESKNQNPQSLQDSSLVRD